MAKFRVPINEANEGESQTYLILDTGDVSDRVSKRKLRAYFKAYGVPKSHIKRLVKEYF